MNYGKQTISVPRKTTLFELKQYRVHSRRWSVLMLEGHHFRLALKGRGRGNHPDLISLSTGLSLPDGHFQCLSNW